MINQKYKSLESACQEALAIVQESDLPNSIGAEVSAKVGDFDGRPYCLAMIELDEQNILSRGEVRVPAGWVGRLLGMHDGFFNERTYELHKISCIFRSRLTISGNRGKHTATIDAIFAGGGVSSHKAAHRDYIRVMSVPKVFEEAYTIALGLIRRT